jgi:hypothetical protein
MGTPLRSPFGQVDLFFASKQGHSPCGNGSPNVLEEPASRTANRGFANGKHPISIPVARPENETHQTLNGGALEQIEFGSFGTATLGREDRESKAEVVSFRMSEGALTRLETGLRMQREAHLLARPIEVRDEQLISATEQTGTQIEPDAFPFLMPPMVARSRQNHNSSRGNPPPLPPDSLDAPHDVRGAEREPRRHSPKPSDVEESSGRSPEIGPSAKAARIGIFGVLLALVMAVPFAYHLGRLTPGPELASSTLEIIKPSSRGAGRNLQPDEPGIVNQDIESPSSSPSTNPSRSGAASGEGPITFPRGVPSDRATTQFKAKTVSPVTILLPRSHRGRKIRHVAALRPPSSLSDSEGASSPTTEIPQKTTRF